MRSVLVFKIHVIVIGIIVIPSVIGATGLVLGSWTISPSSPVLFIAPATTASSIIPYFLCCLLIVLVRLLSTSKIQALVVGHPSATATAAHNGSYNNSDNSNTRGAALRRIFISNNNNRSRNFTFLHFEDTSDGILASDADNTVLSADFEQTASRIRRQSSSNNNTEKGIIIGVIVTTIPNVTIPSSSSVSVSASSTTAVPHLTVVTNQTTDHSMTPDGPTSSSSRSSVLIILSTLAAVLTTLGLLGCLVSHYRHHQHLNSSNNNQFHRRDSHPEEDSPLTAARRCFDSRTTLNPPPLSLQRRQSTPARVNPRSALPMLALEANLERERCALKERQLRLHSVNIDFELNLPPSIQLPDGEEFPYGSSSKLKIRDAEQESEIYQKCIRGPPNRTVTEIENVLPFRSSSTGILSLGSGSTTTSNSDWSHNMIRCHSMNSNRRVTTGPNLPPVILPASAASSSKRQQQKHSSNGLAKITMVPCLTNHSCTTSSSSNSSVTSLNPDSRCTTTSTLSGHSGSHKI